MSSTVVFWFNWFWKALYSMPEFLGNNKAGVGFGMAVALAFEYKTLKSLQGFRKAPNMATKLRLLRSHVMKHWSTSIAPWIIIFVAFLIGHTFDMVREDSDTLANSNRAVVQENVSSKSTCDGEKNELKVQYATQKSRADTLDTQNRDQQTLIAGCQEDAIKRLTPVVPKMTPLLFSDSPEAGGVISTASYVLLTNVNIAPSLVRVECNQDLPDPYTFGAEVLGATSGTGGGGNTFRLGSKTLSFRLDSPVWGPVSPFRSSVDLLVHKDVRCFMKPEYREGPETWTRFQEGMKKLFQAPKLAKSPFKTPAKPKKEKPGKD